MGLSVASRFGSVVVAAEAEAGAVVFAVSDGSGFVICVLIGAGRDAWFVGAVVIVVVEFSLSSLGEGCSVD